MRVFKLGAKAFIPVVLATSVLVSSAPATPASAYTPLVPGSEAAQIIKIAKAQVGDPYRYGAMGPSAFDCSGLVLYSFKAAGDYGTVVRFPTNWAATPTVISPWDGGTSTCNVPRNVWCKQD